MEIRLPSGQTSGENAQGHSAVADDTISVEGIRAGESYEQTFSNYICYILDLSSDL